MMSESSTSMIRLLALNIFAALYLLSLPECASCTVFRVPDLHEQYSSARSHDTTSVASPSRTDPSQSRVNRHQPHHTPRIQDVPTASKAVTVNRSTFVPAASDHAGDAAVLIDLYVAMMGDQWLSSDDWAVNGTSFCTPWYGVTCNCNAGPQCRVQAIDLSSNLVGRFGQVLPESIGDLEYLVSLKLDHNYLTSTVPASIGNLSRLSVLVLKYNYFVSSLPETIGQCSQLTHLDLARNGFTLLPDSISNLTKLQYFDISLNYLPALPEWTIFSSAPVIQTLRLSSSFFRVLRPASSVSWIKSCRMLRSLSISGLTGPFPDWLDSSLAALRELYLNENQFSGCLPDSICQLRSLTRLDILSSALTGPIPNCMHNFSALEYLSLRSNRFSSTIPTALGLLPSLVDLILSDNQFSGEVPTSFRNLTRLTSLTVSRNYLTSGLDSISKLPSLVTLFADFNRLQGTFPSQWSSSKLNELVVNDNYISDTSASILSAMRMLPKLYRLYLSNNRFTGSLPLPDFVRPGRLSTSSLPISEIRFDGNFFYGPLPLSVCNLTSSETIDFSRNMLSGTIPKCIISLCVYESIQVLNFSSNRLVGGIPDFAANGSTLCKLYAIDLSRNSLEGDIPSSLSNLPQLSTLDLSHNRLGNGLSMPRVLFSMPGLLSVDVSGNLFSGNLGDVFKPAQYFPLFLNVSGNSLSGATATVQSQNASDLSASLPVGIIDARGILIDCPVPTYNSSSILFLRDTCRPEYNTFLVAIGCLTAAAVLLIAVRHIFVRLAARFSHSETSSSKSSSDSQTTVTGMGRRSKIQALSFVVQYFVAASTLILDAFTSYNIMMHLLSRIDNCALINSFSIWGAVNAVSSIWRFTFSGDTGGADSLIQTYSLQQFSAFIARQIRVLATSDASGSFGASVGVQYSNFDFCKYESDFLYSSYLASIDSFSRLCASIDSGCAVRRSAAFPTDYATECYLAFDDRAPFGGTGHRTFLYIFIGVIVVRLCVELLRAGLVVASAWQRRIIAKTWSIDFVGTSLFAPLFVVALHGSWTDYFDTVISHETSPAEYAWRIVHQSLLSSLPLLCTNIYFLFYVDQSGVQTVNLMSILAALVTVPLNIARAVLAHRQRDHAFSNEDVAERAARTANRISFSEPLAAPARFSVSSDAESSHTYPTVFVTAVDADDIELPPMSSSAATAQAPNLSNQDPAA